MRFLTVILAIAISVGVGLFVYAIYYLDFVVARYAFMTYLISGSTLQFISTWESLNTSRAIRSFLQFQARNLLARTMELPRVEEVTTLPKPVTIPSHWAIPEAVQPSSIPLCDICGNWAGDYQSRIDHGHHRCCPRSPFPIWSAATEAVVTADRETRRQEACAALLKGTSENGKNPTEGT